MLYDLFMFWIVASISMIAASMVLGGLLCVWCAFVSRRRAERSSAALINQASHHRAHS
jgi:membrane protein implicated in regulation of membrane protease activity